MVFPSLGEYTEEVISASLPSTCTRAPGAAGSAPGTIHAAELAVDVAAGADALHDFLTDVAALGEADGVHLLGFLRKRSFRGYLRRSAACRSRCARGAHPGARRDGRRRIQNGR